MSEKSEIVVQVGPGAGSTSSQTSMTQSSSMSSTSSSSSSSTKTTKVTKTVKTSSSTVVKKSSTGSQSISIKSDQSSFSDSFGKNLGIDVDAEIKKLMGSMQTDSTSTARQNLFHLTPLEPTTSGSELIKLDNKSIMDYIDKNDRDLLKFNFDVSGYQSQTVVVKSDGNKIEVHAKKSSKIGDEERSEEFSRTYEMPRDEAIDPSKITSSFYKDGILSVELPMDLALAK